MIERHFQALDDYLRQNQVYWRFEPFLASSASCLPWQAINPDLCHWLNALSDEEIEQYKSDTDALLAAMTPHFPELGNIKALTDLSPYSPPTASYLSTDVESVSLPRGLEKGIPGRKLRQITLMGSAALAHHKGDEWLEWCSGKGYLGRILASHSQQNVTSFEYQAALCLSGQAEADQMGLTMTFVQGDALSNESQSVLKPNQHAVALHACGDLHVSLMHKSIAAKLPAVTLSPCCYHLIEGETYQALSAQGKASSLGLTQQELRIPLQETVTGGERVKRHRQLEMRYRLGLDCLFRQVLGYRHYESIPSVKKSQLSEGFESFCHWACQQKGIELPSVDFADYEQQGMRRYWQMERLSLCQQVFRRVLELWLVMDKALYLEQNGYRVYVGEFCSRETTPRNILIHAERQS